MRSPDASSKIIVITVQPGDPGQRDVLPLLLMPAAGTETAGLRRVGKALGPEWPVSLVTPPSGWSTSSCYGIEDSAAASAAVIRNTLQQTPFLLGGFCLGGVVAFETARLLQHEGCAGLILFDTPVPGYPKLTPRSLETGALGRFHRVLGEQWKQVDGRGKVVRFLLRKVGWYSVLILRSLLAPLAHVPWIESFLCDKVAVLPLFWRRPLALPILHILAESVGSNLFRGAARFDWEPVAQRGVVYKTVPGLHYFLFVRPNLPALSASILEWIQSLPRTVRQSVPEGSDRKCVELDDGSRLR